jgi:purine-binding chemotaxis protein CheW
MTGTGTDFSQPGFSGINTTIQNLQHSGGKKQEEGSGETFQVVEFLLGQDHFAIDLFDVKEVVEYTRITRLPNSPSYIKGIIDLRGEITTIIDLKQQLAISGTSKKSEEESRIIVLDKQLTSSKIGIMVDDVLTVSTYSSAHVDETATSGEEGTHILGIIKKKSREKDKETTQLIIWIDIRSLLRDIEAEA